MIFGFYPSFMVSEIFGLYPSFIPAFPLKSHFTFIENRMFLLQKHKHHSLYPYNVTVWRLIGQTLATLEYAKNTHIHLRSSISSLGFLTMVSCVWEHLQCPVESHLQHVQHKISLSLSLSSALPLWSNAILPPSHNLEKTATVGWALNTNN